MQIEWTICFGMLISLERSMEHLTLPGILRVIRPYEGGIAFSMSGMHAVEDYIVSRYQMYVQVYFHPVSRGMEVILEHLLHRAHELYQEDASSFELHSQLLLPFLDGSFTLGRISQT